MSRYSFLLGNKSASPPATIPQGTQELESPIVPASTAIPKQETEHQESFQPEAEIHAKQVEVLIHQNDSMTASQHDGKLSSHQDSPPPRQQGSMTAQRPSFHAFLQAKATEKTTVRLPDGLPQYLEDTLYRIKREQRVKITMNAVFIAALASFCLEFEQQGNDSPLYKKLIQELE